MQLAELAYGIFNIADLLKKRQGTNLNHKEAFRKDMFDLLYHQANQNPSIAQECPKDTDKKSNHDNDPIPE